MSLFYMFASLSNVWLNGRQLGSQICFHRQSVLIMLFWLMYMRKVLTHTDMFLGKG